MINQIMIIAGFTVIMLLLIFGFSVGIMQVKATIKDMQLYGVACCIKGVIIGSITSVVCFAIMALLITNIAT